MSAQAFEVRFGELRSLLQQAPSQLGFDAVVASLVTMMHEARGRFEAEVLPYALGSLERWYAACPVELAGQLVVPRVRALSAIQQKMPWLEVARGIELEGMRKGKLLSALARSERLGRLEWLSLRGVRCEEEVWREVLSAPWMEQLVALRLGSVLLLSALEVWRGRDMGRLRMLDMGVAPCRDASLEVLSELVGLEQLVALRLGSVLLLSALEVWRGRDMGRLRMLDMGVAPCRDASLEVLSELVGLEQLVLPSSTSRARRELLRVARWEGLRQLSFGESSSMMEEDELEVLVGRGWPLEVLLLPRCFRHDAEVAARVGRIGALRRLRIVGRHDASWPLEALLGGVGESLEMLDLVGVTCEQGAVLSAPRLRALRLWTCTLGVAQAVCGSSGLGALRELSLYVEAGAGGALCEALAGASGLGQVRILRVGRGLSSAHVRRLLCGELVPGLELLELGVDLEDGYGVASALVEREDVLGEVSKVRVPYQVRGQVKERCAGTWLEGRLDYYIGEHQRFDLGGDDV
jgi:hypothetical protein